MQRNRVILDKMTTAFDQAAVRRQVFNCSACAMDADYRTGEWSCRSCPAWYHTTNGTTQRVYDRETTPEQMTQEEQVIILLASHELTRRGQRYLVDFGWRNAVEKAQDLL